MISQSKHREDRPFILVSEVGPRDGLQSITSVMSTAAKKAWISATADAGLREIEVGSFVPANVLPQLADTREIVTHARSIANLTVAVLVPNLRGADAAVSAGAHKITLPVSVSASHSVANVRKTPQQMIEEAKKISDMIRGLPATDRPIFECGLSTAFGCSIEGTVTSDAVMRLAEALLKVGCDEICLSDTVGYANPVQVRSLVRAVRSEFGRQACSAIHLHNTRGLGLANVLASLEEGITTIDSSLAGIGGCPFAPGASGNVVTEDLVFMLEAMGYETGIDLDRLLKIRSILRQALPTTPLYGFTSDAGLPKGNWKGCGRLL
jgi:hydroxymethylglutaryl-CoA lyase